MRANNQMAVRASLALLPLHCTLSRHTYPFAGACVLTCTLFCNFQRERKDKSETLLLTLCHLTFLDPINVENNHQKSISSYPSRSDLSASSSGETEAPPPVPSARRNKSKSTFALLGRSRSVRDKENGRHKPPPAQVPLPAASSNPPPPDNTNTSTSTNSTTTIASQAATVSQDRAPKDDGMNSHGRGRPEDRMAGAASSTVAKDAPREKEQRAHSSSIRETSASTFLSGLRYSSTRAADIISKGLFGKSSRSGSTTEKEPVIDDEHYVLKVINLPLVEQTRMTRISKRLEDSRDKTEFWMPAFPWRAIDYLNYKGTEVEGLYRVPGSGPQVKKWQRKFDERAFPPFL